ncbi:unnamed protein product [Discula destructiva]
MPPRIPAPSGLKSMTLCLRPALPPNPLQPLVQKASLTQRQREKAKPHKAHLDPYREALRLERRARNLNRRGMLTAERTLAHGHPVHGITTPYLESLDSAGQAPLSPVKTDGEGKPLEEAHPLPTTPHILNYRLTRAELDDAIAESYELTKPADGEAPGPISETDPEFIGMEKNPLGHASKHAKAVEALRRITTLENASSRDRRFANIRRIVDEFGRHKTDLTVRPKGRAADAPAPVEKIRGGPDTGSSEVQIAILTAKIRVLVKMYSGPKGNKDKHNKRNLRLLCHRRQKLLKYMERKERGSGRWEHMVDTLGLSEATWKGQIEIR